MFPFPDDHTSSPQHGIHFIQTPLLHKQVLRFWKGIANLPWVTIELSNLQSWTHAAVAHGLIWLCAFGPAVLHGCTPLM